MLDTKDEKILAILKKNAKQSVKAISDITKIPPTTVHNRIKKMEEQGVIKGYTVKVSNKKAGKPVTTYVLMMVDHGRLKKIDKTQQDLASEIKELNDGEDVAVVTGKTDIVVKAHVRDIDDLNDFITVRLKSIDGVLSTRSLVVLDDLED